MRQIQDFLTHPDTRSGWTTYLVKLASISRYEHQLAILVNSSSGGFCASISILPCYRCGPIASSAARERSSLALDAVTHAHCQTDPAARAAGSGQTRGARDIWIARYANFDSCDDNALQMADDCSHSVQVIGVMKAVMGKTCVRRWTEHDQCCSITQSSYESV